MMKLSTMKALTDTLNDKWVSAVADQILSYWEHDQGTAKYFRASANFQFVFQQAGERYFLRFNHSSERDFNHICAEVDYIHYLSSKGIRVATPVPSIAGHFVESVSTPQGIFHAVVFEAMVGKQFEIQELSPEIFTAWGKALGELHKAAQGYQEATRPTWKDHLAMVSEYLPETEHAAKATFRELQEELSRSSINKSNYGLIHFDFELDNIVWDGDEAGLIDFDDSSYYWFVADIAFALRDLFEDSAIKVDLQNESFQNFLAGYRLVKDISEEELALIPMFLRLHNLITFAKLHRTLGTAKEQDEPIWLDELRKKLSEKMQFYRNEFSQKIR